MSELGDKISTELAYQEAGSFDVSLSMVESVRHQDVSWEVRTMRTGELVPSIESFGKYSEAERHFMQQCSPYAQIEWN